jgi:hypothetical protein
MNPFPAIVFGEHLDEVLDSIVDEPPLSDMATIPSPSE